MSYANRPLNRQDYKTLTLAALGGALGLAGLGLMDDRRSLPARARFLAQAIAAGVFLVRPPPRAVAPR